MIFGGAMRKADQVDETLQKQLTALKEEGFTIVSVTPIAGDGVVSFFLELKKSKK